MSGKDLLDGLLQACADSFPDRERGARRARNTQNGNEVDSPVGSGEISGFIPETSDGGQGMRLQSENWRARVLLAFPYPRKKRHLLQERGVSGAGAMT